MDTDLLLLDDISKLWSFWFKFARNAAFGLTENLSDWYLINDSVSSGRIWPASVSLFLRCMNFLPYSDHC